MIKREFQGKEYLFNPLSFSALEEVEKQTGKSIYKIIQGAGQLSLREIQSMIYSFSKHGETVISPDVFQNMFVEEGLNFFSDIVNECILSILSGKPKTSEEDKKKEKIAAKKKN